MLILATCLLQIFLNFVEIIFYLTLITLTRISSFSNRTYIAIHYQNTPIHQVDLFLVFFYLSVDDKPSFFYTLPQVRI
jgi:hypothetical protein